MSLLGRMTAGVRRFLRIDAKEAVDLAPYGAVPDPGLGGFGANNLFRQWMGIYQLIDRMARARGGVQAEKLADDRMLYIARGLKKYNPYAQGMISALRNHTLGARGFKHTPMGPSRKVLGDWLERWKADVDWWMWEREIYERVHTEGGSVMRFFPEDDTVQLRPVELEWIIPRDGTKEWTFGFYNEPGDVHDVTALHEMTDGPGEVVDAAFWYHVKSKMTVRAEKRGQSDFLPVAQLLDDSFKTWRNFLQSEAVRQGVIYFAKQAPGVTSADLDQAIAAEADYGPPTTVEGVKLGDAMKMQYGAAVEYIQDGTEILAVPAANAQGTMTGVNAGLLAAGRAYHIPLVLMSGDMSANNTLDFGDESPFGMTVQDEQNWFSRHVRNIMWRAVEFAVDEGQLPASLLYDGTDIQVAAERSKGQNALQNTQRIKVLYDDGVISGRERATAEGYDYDEQQNQRAREAVGAGVDSDGVTEDTLVVVHRKGKTFTERRKSGKGKVESGAKQPAAEQLASTPLDTRLVPQGLIPKMRAAAKKVWFEAAVRLDKLNAPALMVAKVLGEVFDTPDDMRKFAYNPTASGFGNHANNDFVAANLHDAFGVGISGHLVAGIAARVIAKAYMFAKAKLAKQSAAATEDVTAGIPEYADFLAQTYANTFKALKLKGAVPTAEAIAKTLAELVK